MNDTKSEGQRLADALTAHVEAHPELRGKTYWVERENLETVVTVRVYPELYK